ncbi:MAG: pilus (MSHA type) biogenesis protein MshL [Halobacteria archaeon]|nr:pilus (MSHA type) biogenesis protein MshL [Halobacteria archaeon]
MIHRGLPLLSLLLAACQTVPVENRQNLASITAALEESARPLETATSITPPPEVARALLPPVQVNIQEIVNTTEPRFDISVNATSAHQFFMSLVKGTDKNMVVHPNVNGEISLSLNNVTIEEILMTVRDVYGFEFRRSNNTYQVFPGRMRTRIFNIDYLDVQRSGSSRTRVSSGQLSNGGSGGSAGGDTGQGGSATSGGQVSGSVVRTDSESDFWKGIRESLDVIVGNEEGRKVVLHPQSGAIIVHALPGELREVEEFLATVEDSVHRLVILEAKIIEVTLNDNFQSGINWSALIEAGTGKSLLLGQTGGGSIFDTGASEFAGAIVPLDGTQITGLDTSAFGGMFSINANLKDFNGFIELLETQGDVQVLSSPRVATVNNQKAVIKVGQDEYFVTDVETDTEIGNSGDGNTNVDVELTPFFSGVALDVIPQIGQDKSVILHVHPTVSEVTEKVKNITVSSSTELSVPLALSTIRESDTVIRANSGQVVVIGGLMKDVSRNQQAQTPVLGDAPGFGSLFRHNRQVSSKSELVILLRPVVINDNNGWNNDLGDTARRYQNLRAPGIPMSP